MARLYDAETADAEIEIDDDETTTLIKTEELPNGDMRILMQMVMPKEALVGFARGVLIEAGIDVPEIKKGD